MAEPIAPLEARDVSLLRIPWISNYDTVSLGQFLATSDAPSLWIPATGEYALGGWWRGRHEVGQIVELAARSSNRPRLVEALVAAFSERQVQAVVPSPNEVWRESRWYRQHGFREIDRILTMALSPLVVPAAPEGGLEIRPYQPRHLEALTVVDRASFPWLWWNDPVDFARYAALEGVTVLTGWWQGELVAYASTTLRGRRGHLDRLAVRPSEQGRGFGRALLTAALRDLSERGAREVALTTQVTNRVAQALYRSVGFRRTEEVEPILGRWLGPSPDDGLPFLTRPGS
ncbi:MAG: GNAT family N-acetyltransferase [Chloroflexi bacterium]|nr:GNAT family N-acetyltransferase [Chloroflexota bacterium]